MKTNAVDAHRVSSQGMGSTGRSLGCSRRGETHRRRKREGLEGERPRSATYQIPPAWNAWRFVRRGWGQASRPWPLLRTAAVGVVT